MALFKQNETQRKETMAGQIDIDIERYEFEEKAAIETQNVLNKKIARLIDERNAAGDRASIASQAVLKLKEVRENIDEMNRLEKWAKEQEEANE